MEPERGIEGILGALVDAEVDFIVIGGVAVGWHGFVRATKDVDVVPDPDPANLTRLAELLRDLGAEVDGAEDFDRGELPDPTDPAVLELGGNWVLRTRLGRLDLMQVQGEIDLWEKLAGGALDGELNERPIRVCSYEDLVDLKRDAGRPQDLVDVEQLEIARGRAPQEDG